MSHQELDAPELADIIFNLPFGSSGLTAGGLGDITGIFPTRIPEDAFRRPPLQSGLPAIPIPFPVPTPAPPKPVTSVPFPSGPAANDPRFLVSKVSALFRLGGVVITGAIFVRDILFLAQEEAINKAIIEQKLALETELQRRKLRKLSALIVLPDPDVILNPSPAEVVTTAPRPMVTPRIDIVPTLPEVTPQIPDFPVPKPAAPTAPSVPTPTLPRQMPRPVPVPIGVPTPLPRPSKLPRRFPAPVPFPGVFPFLSPLPRTFFVGRPAVTPSNLTRFRPTVQESPTIGSITGLTTSISPQVATEAQTQCQVVKRRRRRKGKCREGFFSESPGSTKFVTWRERDCQSSRSLGGKVVDIFGG